MAGGEADKPEGMVAQGTMSNSDRSNAERAGMELLALARCFLTIKYHPGCVSFLLSCNKLLQSQHLNTTQIHYITGSIGQKSRHRMAGFSA